mmetsp:Transcript_27757/g.31163  ORF Transcript_27757/g.31163 Transcript_27757/m.31163 type:complete len:447 (+) Transcript_27757:70-1410(+)
MSVEEGLSNGTNIGRGNIMETTPPLNNNGNHDKDSDIDNGDSNDDDESVIDISKQTNRPSDIPIQQQSINAWHPILDPNWMIISYLILAVIMIPFGYYLEKESEKIVELKQVYDAGGNANITEACPSIGTEYNANKNCTITFNVTKQMNPPVLIYYGLTNFHQNYRKYTVSRDDYQLTGQVGNQSALSAIACEPINILGGTTINPCGLIANTFFNDKFTLSMGNNDASDGGGAGGTTTPVDDKGKNLLMIEEGIAWQSDMKYRFKMPKNYNHTLCPDQSTPCDSTSTCCSESFPNFSCTQPARSPKDNKCYAYNYPLQDTTQYLYQTYPSVISPLEHVTNEHFIVWMRVASQPSFRKLYGYIDQTIPAGTVLNFDVNMNYVVESFSGTKSLSITTNSMWGTKDSSIGVTIYSIGYFCLACGIFFGLKHFIRPRKIADRKYLHYKED